MTEKHLIKTSIRLKLLFTLIGLIVGLLAILTLVQTFYQEKILKREMEVRIALMKENLVERGKTLSDYLSRHVENGMTSYNISSITEIINKSVNEDENLEYVILEDYSSKAYIHTLYPGLENEILLDQESSFAVKQSKANMNEFTKNGDSFLEFIVPINIGMNPWGVLRIGFSLRLLNKKIANSRIDFLKQSREIMVWTVVTAIIFTFIGGVIIYIIARKLTNPIISLTKSAREISKGNFGFAEKIEIKSRDEIGILGSTFVEMSEQLRISHEKLEDYSYTLEQKVAKRTNELKIANEKLYEIDKSKTEFLSVVSHEVRTPLTLILGFARMIRKKMNNVILPKLMVEDKVVQKSTSQIKDNLDTIVSEGDRLTILLDDLLDLTKIESGKIEWGMKPVSVSEVIEKAIKVTSSYFEQYGLELIKDVEGGLHSIVGDKDRLEQVVINLFFNAIKFTDKGSITCRARKIGNEIIVSIIDTGKGIDESNQKRIFEKFSQVDTKLKGQLKGTGLGLSICKQIIEHHDGRIWVESEPGKGSNFSFSLPLSDCECDG